MSGNAGHSASLFNKHRFDDVQVPSMVAHIEESVHASYSPAMGPSSLGYQSMTRHIHQRVYIQLFGYLRH